MSKKKHIYVFPSRSQCPRCGGLQTRAYSTQGSIQYRRCLAPICGQRYHVRGQPMEKKKEVEYGQTSTTAEPAASLAGADGETD